MSEVIEALARLQLAVEKELGTSDGVTQVTFSREAFNRLLYKLYEQKDYRAVYQPSDISNAELIGIPIRARDKEELK